MIRMPTLDDVINYILTTEDLADLPTIMDALTERVATEMWLVAEQSNPAAVEEAPVEEAPAEEIPAEEQALPPLSL